MVRLVWWAICNLKKYQIGFNGLHYIHSPLKYHSKLGKDYKVTK